MKALVLTRGRIATVEDQDFPELSLHKWHAIRSRCGNYYGARTTGPKASQQLIYLHCEIMGFKGVDHKDGDGLNCLRGNLRAATPRQNQQARCRKRVGKTSKYRGVSWCITHSKWVACIRINGKSKTIGRYLKEDEAARAYDGEARSAFGTFSQLNFSE